MRRRWGEYEVGMDAVLGITRKQELMYQSGQSRVSLWRP